MKLLDPLPIYVKWVKEGCRVGTGQRFGQYYFNQALPLTSWPELFFCEDDIEAYTSVCQKRLDHALDEQDASGVVEKY